MGMQVRGLLLHLCVWASLCLWGCADNPSETAEIKHFAADDTAGVIDHDRVAADPDISVDGGGSFRIDTDSPLTVRLYQVDGLNFDETLITYSAKLRTRDLAGDTYLEMWCHFPDHGDYFSRDVEHPLSGTSDWTSVSTPFTLQKGQVVESVRLNLVILGTGTVWIDDIRLQRQPLHP